MGTCAPVEMLVLSRPAGAGQLEVKNPPAIPLIQVRAKGMRDGRSGLAAYLRREAGSQTVYRSVQITRVVMSQDHFLCLSWNGNRLNRGGFPMAKELADKLAMLAKAIDDYRFFTVEGDPEVLDSTETGSRVVYARDAIEKLLAELDGQVDLSTQKAIIYQCDRYMREHAAEIWERCKYDGRDIEREEYEKPSYSRWWWYLDKPEVWPPLKPGPEEE